MKYFILRSCLIKFYHFDIEIINKNKNINKKNNKK